MGPHIQNISIQLRLPISSKYHTSTTMTQSIVLILRSGTNISHSVARKFAAAGYVVAISARNLEDGSSPDGYITIKGDYFYRDAIPTVFDKLKVIAGIPNVVIYNGKIQTSGVRVQFSLPPRL